MTPARLAAARVLMQVESGRHTLASAVDRARAELTDDRDRALIVELTAGVMRWRAALDAALSVHSRRPLDTLAPAVRASLRLGAYQLRHLSRVPVHAAVNESVGLTRTLGHPAAAGFVNAVLRRVAADRDSPPAPLMADASSPLGRQIEFLATNLSHPRWLIERWLDRYGFDATRQWLDFNNRTPDMTVRVRRGRVSIRENANRDPTPSIQPGRWAPQAVRLAPGTLGRLPPEFREAVEIQDEVSQLVAAIADVRPGERVLDVCAAPGGKTLVMAEGLEERGLLVAADARPARVRLLRQTASRAATPVHIVALDARAPLPFPDATFDCVLLDAPCSGVGTLRRDPDLKWSRRPSDLATLTRDQLRMIESAAAVVRPGGRLIYATCSPEPEENDAIVDHLLATRADFVLARPDERLGLSPLLDDRGLLRTLPFRDELDAYVAAVLVRRQGA